MLDIAGAVPRTKKLKRDLGPPGCVHPSGPLSQAEALGRLEGVGEAGGDVLASATGSRRAPNLYKLALHRPQLMAPLAPLRRGFSL
jgi:hypothetical protein